MFDVLLSNINSVHEAMRNVERGQYQSKIQHLEAALHRETARANYYEQLYIREKQINDRRDAKN